MTPGEQKPAPLPEKRNRGEQPYKPTAKLAKKIEMLSAVGMTQEEIALIVDVERRTLQRHYKHALRVGGLKADAEVLSNLYRMAIGNGPEAGKTAIFWAKVRRRWHEVQRVIHGYDPAMINNFVTSVVQILRRYLPRECPHCKVALALPEKVASELQELSRRMAETLPESEIQQRPVPELASDGLDNERPGGEE